MRIIPNYKTADEILAALDTGGSFWDVASRANDGVLSPGELTHAAGLSQAYVDYFLQHILWDLPHEDIERVRRTVPDAFMKSIHHKNTAPKEPWLMSSEHSNWVQFLTTEGILKPHRDSALENIPVFGANDLSQPLQVKVPDPLVPELLEFKLLSKPVGQAFWLYHLLQDDLSPTPNKELPLVLSSKKQPLLSFSEPVRLTVCWGGLYYASRDAYADRRSERIDRDYDSNPFGLRDEYSKGFDYLQRPDGEGNFNDHTIADRTDHMNMRVLFCTPLDEAEASQMLSAANQNDQDISSDLLRHSLTHRVK